MEGSGRPVAERALIALFLGILALPAADLALGLDPSPPVSDRTKGRVPFGFRNSLVRLHGLYKVGLWGVSASPRVIVGTDGWLFLNDEGAPEEYRRSDPFGPDALSRWVGERSDRRRWLEERGIRYLFVVTPDKHGVYGDHLPASHRARSPGPSRLDQLMNALPPSFPAVDLRPALARARAEGRSYHRTDTHWNDRGAWAGYRAVVRELRRAFPEVTPLGPEELRISTRRSEGGDLARMLGLRKDLPEELVLFDLRSPTAEFRDGALVERREIGGKYAPLRFTRARRGEIDRALVLHDSFMFALAPYLSEHFGEAHWEWRYDLPRDLVERIGPSVVIEQITERRLMHLAPDGSAAPR